MLGSLMLDLKDVRTIMFQLSGFYYRTLSKTLPRGKYSTEKISAPGRKRIYLGSVSGLNGFGV